MHHRVATRSRGRALNARYEAVLAHYGVKSTRTNPRSSHENGVVEEGYREFVRRVVDRRNRLVGSKLRRERRHLRPFAWGADTRARQLEVTECSVTSSAWQQEPAKIVDAIQHPRRPSVVKGGDRGRGPLDVAMGSAAAGERVRGLGQGPTPPVSRKEWAVNPKLSHYYVPVFSSTRLLSTQTLVLGSWPWPRGLFTLSARLVDGAGAGRCRMLGTVSDQSWPVYELGAAGIPGRWRGQGSESSQTYSRGSRVRPQLNPTRITRLPSCSRASTPSTAARGRDAD